MCSCPTPFPSTSSNIKNASDELDRRDIKIHVLVFRSMHGVYILKVWRHESLPTRSRVSFPRQRIRMKFGWCSSSSRLRWSRSYGKLKPNFIAFRDLKHSWTWLLFNKTRSLTVFRCSILLQLWCGWLHNKWLVSAINEHPRPVSSRIVKKRIFKVFAQQELDSWVGIVPAVSWTAEQLWLEFLQGQGIFLFQIVRTYAGA